MTRTLTAFLAALPLALPALAAPTQADMQAELRKLQEAQARLAASMMREYKSRLGFQDTLRALTEAARKHGWEIGPTFDMQAAMMQAGQKDARPFSMLTLCRRDLAEELLKAQAAHQAMPFAPCRMSVFVAPDGKTYIAKPNTELMAQMALPVFATTLKKFDEAEKAVLAGIIE